MMIFFYIAAALLFLYGILFQYYQSWWNALPVFTANADAGETATLPISVIIAARNEEVNIAGCLQHICMQEYPSHLLQIIVIDDSSSDNTFAIASSFSDREVQVICHRLEPLINNTAPKKRAIEKGISLASGTLIITTDADCQAEPGWLKTLVAYYENAGVVFVAAPVKIQDGGLLLTKFQALDFLTMQGITAASVSKQFHNMCNGANLAYAKTVFHEVNGFTGIDVIASGDDMLLMNKIAKRFPGRLGFIKSPAAIVTTTAAADWKSFFQQRIRWASKATHYRQPKIFAVLLLVYLVNLFLFCFLLMGFLQPFAWLLFLLLCFAKFSFEFLFVKTVASFFKQTQLLPWLLLLQPLHIIYIVASGFLGQFKSYEWKGRKLK